MGFFRQEYWSGLPFPPPGDLPDPGVETTSPALQAVSCIAGGFFTVELQGKPKSLWDSILILCYYYPLFSLPTD